MTTRLTLATAGSITADAAATPARPGPIPAGTTIMLESDELTTAFMSALADGTRTIRGVPIPFGSKLGDDTLGPQGRRVHFGGDVPDGIACASFDLTTAPAPSRPTATLTPASVTRRPTDAPFQFTWAVTDATAISMAVRDGTTGRERIERISGDVDIPASNSGTFTVQPSKTTTYRLIASGPGGVATAEATLIVASGTVTNPVAMTEPPSMVAWWRRRGVLRPHGVRWTLTVVVDNATTLTTTVTPARGNATVKTESSLGGTLHEFRYTVITQHTNSSTPFAVVLAATGAGGTTTSPSMDPDLWDDIGDPDGLQSPDI